METRAEPDERVAKVGFQIEDLHSDATQLSAEEFEKQYGSAFLLLSSAGFEQSKSASSTEVLLLDLDEGIAECTADVSVRILPIRAAQSSLTHLITIGRTSKNDVTISDLSVSRFHAFLKHNPAGGFQLHDAGSSNGTTVNGRSVSTKEAGPPMNITSGDNIRFGQVDVTFLEADALRSYVAKFGD